MSAFFPPQMPAFLQPFPFHRTHTPHPNLPFPNTTTHPSPALHPSFVLVASASPRRMPSILRPMVPSPTLLQFVEDKVHQRSNVIRAVGDYIRENNLQDPNDRRMVLCDDKLRTLFGVDKCTMQQVTKYISPHLLKPETVGGRYLDEAKRIEEDYVREKERLGIPARKRKKNTTQTPKKVRAYNHLVQPVTLSPELAAICRAKELARPQIVKAVWEYIRMNNLKGEPGSPIRCDYLMRQVYKADEIDIKDVMKGMEGHISKPQ